jgi:ATP-dependent Lon protease
MDHYLAVPFDLSRVMFITTGNLTDTIPSPLRDRMEILYLSGYTAEEKLQIAKKYLVPKQLEEHGITTKIMKINDSAISQIISHYTREAGVRNLEREIANLCRKVAKQVAEGKAKVFNMTSANISKYIGAPKFMPEEEMKHSEVGVSTGLAWTEAGGDVIFIEASLMKGKGTLTLTGQLGDVMKESAQTALSYVRSKEKELGISADAFSQNDLHIHVPAGAIPKDGPSAGITMATAIASAFTGRPVKKDVAMTGEITLRGRVLGIGGLKEKALAAKRMGIKTIVVPKRNKKDLDELPKYVKEGMNFLMVDTAEEVIRAALEPLKSLGSSRAGAAKSAVRPGLKAKVIKKAGTLNAKQKTRSKGRVKTSQKNKSKI